MSAFDSIPTEWCPCRPNKFLAWLVFICLSLAAIYICYYIFDSFFCFEWLSIHPCSIHIFGSAVSNAFYVCIPISNDDLSLFLPLNPSLSITERPAGKYNFLFLDISIKISIKWHSVVGLYICVCVCVVYNICVIEYKIHIFCMKK